MKGRHMRRAAYLEIIVAAFAAGGCNNNFVPVVDYHPELIVYSILYPDNDTTYVRLLSLQQKFNYDVSGDVAGANVNLISDSGDTTVLKERTVLYVGYSPVVLYAGIANLKPLTSYQVNASKSGFPTASTRVFVLGHTDIKPAYDTDQVLKDPAHNYDDIYYTLSFPLNPAMLLANFEIAYVGVNSVGDTITGENGVSMYVFPPQGKSLTLEFSRIAYQDSLDAVISVGKDLSGMHIYARLITTEMDSAIYKFYFASTGAGVPNTLRQNQVIYTNVNNGMGVVGSACIDSLDIVVQ